MPLRAHLVSLLPPCEMGVPIWLPERLKLATGVYGPCAEPGPALDVPALPETDAAAIRVGKFAIGRGIGVEGTIVMPCPLMDWRLVSAGGMARVPRSGRLEGFGEVGCGDSRAAGWTCGVGDVFSLTSSPCSGDCSWWCGCELIVGMPPLLLPSDPGGIDPPYPLSTSSEVRSRSSLTTGAAAARAPPKGSVAAPARTGVGSSDFQL